MGVLEDAVLKIRETAEVAGKKTSEFVDTSKVKVNIASLEKKIESEYAELGKMVYKAAKEKADCTDYVNEKVTAIDVIKEQKQALVDKLNLSRNIKVCPKCGAENEQSDVYCSKCGEKL